MTRPFENSKPARGEDPRRDGLRQVDEERAEGDEPLVDHRADGHERVDDRRCNGPIFVQKSEGIAPVGPFVTACQGRIFTTSAGRLATKAWFVRSTYE